MSELNIQILGDVTILRDGEAQALPPSRKTRALLAYLVLNPRKFTREHLCELLWEIPDDPRGALRWSLSKLRRLVDEQGDQRIIANRTHVAFEPRGANIDALALEQFCQQGFEQVDTNTLLAAAERFDGAFLGGLELSDFYDFHTWSIGQREKVAREQAAIHMALVQRFLDDPRQRFVHAQKLVELTPWEEISHVQLIAALVDQGRKKEAQQQANLAADRLRDYGVEPTVALRLSLGGNKSSQQHQSDSRETISSSDRSETMGKVDIGSDPLPLPASRREALKFASDKIFGRDAEITKLIATFNTLCDEARARLILLSGEAGIGKSTLLQTMKAMAQQVDVCLLEADAFESEIVRPFALWHDAFRRNSSPQAPAVLHSDVPVSREQLFAALDEVIKRESGERPVVVVFDDLHWCDESSAAALHYLLRMNRDRPMVAIVAGRSVELKENKPMQQALRGLRGEKLLDEIMLEPLAADVVEALINEHVPGADLSRLARESGGIPLLAIELARAELAGDSSGSLSELVHDRLCRLSEEAVEIVLWSSVLAPNINMKTLKAMTGLPEQRLQQGLEAAQAQGMLVPAHRGFKFVHDLIGRAVYDQISTARQQGMHHRVAEYLEVESALDLELAADMAHHAEKSGDAAQAARALVSAGRLCLRYYANEDALELARSGLLLVDQLPDAERVCLTLELSEVLVSAAPVDDWEEAAERYVELAEDALDHGALPAARLGYHLASSLRWMHGDWALARADTLQAERVSRGATDEEHILGMAETGKCLALLERDLSQADAMIMEADALASRKRMNCPAIAEASGILRYYEGKFEQAEEALLAARAQSKANGDRIAEYQANEYLFMSSFERGDLGMAQRYCNTLVKIGEKIREGSELPFARALRALLEFVDQRESSSLKDALQALRDVDAKHRLSYVLNRLAFSCLDAGHLQEAEEYASEALNCSLLLSRASELTLARLALARVYENSNRADERDAQVAEIRALSSSGLAEWARRRSMHLLDEIAAREL